MKNLVIVSFPAKPETINNLKETLKSALPDTRNFDGCISVKTFIEESTNTIYLIEDWESLEHQQKYLALDCHQRLSAWYQSLFRTVKSAKVLSLRRYLGD